jgi:hypothetical protein
MRERQFQISGANSLACVIIVGRPDSKFGPSKVERNPSHPFYLQQGRGIPNALRLTWQSSRKSRRRPKCVSLFYVFAELRPSWKVLETPT